MCQIRGNIDEIHHKKTPLELSDIGWIDVYDSAEEETS